MGKNLVVRIEDGAALSRNDLFADMLFRGQLGFSVSFLEEMWSRNLGNLMISPLRPIEFVCALMIMSLIRLAIGMIPVTLLATTNVPAGDAGLASGLFG